MMSNPWLRRRNEVKDSFIRRNSTISCWWANHSLKSWKLAEMKLGGAKWWIVDGRIWKILLCSLMLDLWYAAAGYLLSLTWWRSSNKIVEPTGSPEPTAYLKRQDETVVQWLRPYVSAPIVGVGSRSATAKCATFVGLSSVARRLHVLYNSAFLRLQIQIIIIPVPYAMWMAVEYKTQHVSYSMTLTNKSWYPAHKTIAVVRAIPV